MGEKAERSSDQHRSLSDAWLRGKDPAQGITLQGDDKKDTKGYALKVTGHNPDDKHRHLWLQYEVEANYDYDLPSYVERNIKHEAEANKNNAERVKKRLAKHIERFENVWAEEAFPSTFDCKVTYYSATFKKEKPYMEDYDEELTLDPAL